MMRVGARAWAPTERSVAGSGRPMLASILCNQLNSDKGATTHWPSRTVFSVSLLDSV